MTDVHSGNYRFECRTCDTTADLPAPSLTDAKRQARNLGWVVGRTLLHGDGCPACKKASR